MKENGRTTKTIPAIDLHCDLLEYLVAIDGATPDDADGIGCAFPRLAEGNVKIQVLAAFAATGPGSAPFAEKEVERFLRLLREEGDRTIAVRDASGAETALSSDRTGLVLALENASSLCGEEEPLEAAFERFERFRAVAGPILYVSLTHHAANRFGGGNYAEGELTGEGGALLDFLSGKGTAVDLSHTSDPLARGILDRIDRRGLDLPVLASHSNFRAVCDQPRNLPDDLAREIVRRGGVIGMNLLRLFLGLEDPEALLRHVEHGLSLGAGSALALGADYYYTGNHPDRSRVPFHNPGQEHAGRTQEILRSLEGILGEEGIPAFAHGNALAFLERVIG